MDTDQTFPQSNKLSAVIAALRSYPFTYLVIVLGALSFAVYLLSGIAGFALLGMTQTLAELREGGEYWRVLTPVFIHYTWPHIGVNLYLWWLFAPLIERFSRVTLVVLFFGAGILGNISQFLLTGVEFGGLSGVVYALFAYILLISKLAPEKGLFIAPWLSWALLALLLLGFTPLLGLISNGAHVTGLIWGALCASATHLRKVNT
ncbi:MAG: hypothetical protein COA42_15780 [Alteromonadaceae bacterium]|nr:MAG: hypothetical protein COA42_15780 [Alteromonadaceae bacterium]